MGEMPTGAWRSGSNRSDHDFRGPKPHRVRHGLALRNRLAMGMARAGIEPATPRFSGIRELAPGGRKIPAKRRPSLSVQQRLDSRGYPGISLGLGPEGAFQVQLTDP